MPEKFKNIYRIESNRLQFWNYSSSANYFITICTYNRKCILGNIVNDKIQLSPYGEIVNVEIQKIPEYHKRVILNEWIIMPNHIHCIITLENYDFDNGVSLVNNDDENDYNNEYNIENDFKNDTVTVEKIHEFSLQPRQLSQSSKPQQNQPKQLTITNDIKQYRKQRRNMLIPKLLGKFKMKSSKQINILRNMPGEKIWQPNYYDHVIRDNESYQRIKNYIITNPQKWNDDKFHSF